MQMCLMSLPWHAGEVGGWGAALMSQVMSHHIQAFTGRKKWGREGREGEKEALRL